VVGKGKFANIHKVLRTLSYAQRERDWRRPRAVRVSSDYSARNTISRPDSVDRINTGPLTSASRIALNASKNAPSSAKSGQARFVTANGPGSNHG